MICSAIRICRYRKYLAIIILNHYDVRKTPRLIIIAKKKIMNRQTKEKRLYSDGRTTDALT